jgi:hypothetical protein
MRESMEARLGLLRKEFEAGQAELERVEQQRTYLHETMLRISGAIQVLEELLAQGPANGQDRPHTGELQAPISQKDDVSV